MTQALHISLFLRMISCGAGAAPAELCLVSISWEQSVPCLLAVFAGCQLSPSFGTRLQGVCG